MRQWEAGKQRRQRLWTASRPVKTVAVRLQHAEERQGVRGKTEMGRRVSGPLLCPLGSILTHALRLHLLLPCLESGKKRVYGPRRKAGLCNGKSQKSLS